MEQKLFMGTSGLILPYKNKSFYPEALQEKSRLAVYGLLFQSLEVNSSFYKMPRAKTLAKWASEVPETFRFTFKLWKGITHNKGFTFEANDVKLFMEAIDAVDTKIGCLLVQLPPSATVAAAGTMERLLGTIAACNKGNRWRLCVEFRHVSWYRASTFAMLDRYDAAIVFHDKLNGSMSIEETEAPFVYLRFHGPGGNYRGSYASSLLQEYSYYAKEWLEAGKEVFVYFNNTMGEAINNLNTLNKYINEDV